MAFYKIVAHVGTQRFEFNQPDWNTTTQAIWRFNGKVEDLKI